MRKAPPTGAGYRNLPAKRRDLRPYLADMSKSTTVVMQKGNAVDTFATYETGGYYIVIWLVNWDDGRVAIVCGDSTNSMMSVAQETVVLSDKPRGENRVTCQTGSGLSLTVYFTAQNIQKVYIKTIEGQKELQRR